MKLIYYSPGTFEQISDKPDIKIWMALFDLYQLNISFVDRTNVIRTPIKTESPIETSLPVSSSFNLSFDECAVKTAERIYKKHESTGVPIRLHWSGGIDSSAAVAAFIDLLGAEKASKTIEIVMSANGMIENPYMWEKIIRKEKFKIINSLTYEDKFNSEYIAVNGEGGDQIHGGDIYRPLISKFGPDILNKNWNETLVIEFIRMRTSLNQDESEFLAQLLIKQIRLAPVAIETMADFFWWLNFTCKWNCTFYRLLTKSVSPIERATINNHFFPFYSSEEFQLWSMYMRHEKHKGNWDTYKWKAKDYVCKILKDNSYQAKHRQGSLTVVMSHTPRYEAIDSNFNFHTKLNPLDWYEPNNDFIR